MSESKEEYRYCGEHGFLNMKEDMKEILNACGSDVEFLRLYNEAKEELDEAAFELDQESSVTNL